MKRDFILIIFFLMIFPFLLLADQDDEMNKEQQRLFIHGYLTQAYAKTTKHTFLGINEDGTSDYRMAALQFRYALTDNDNFVIQFSHERIGRSPVMQFKDEVELDWIFYEHRFNDNTSIKIGKVQIPVGIYNEIRDVGTILPFYRPIFSFYFEGAYSNETVDGVVVFHRINLKNGWDIDLDAYFGRWDVIMLSDKNYETEARNAIGFQSWFNTPFENLRFGLGAMRYKSSEFAVGDLGEECTWKQWHFSTDFSYSRYIVQFEYKNINFKNGSYKTMYAILGADLISKLRINLAIELSDFEFTLPPFPTLKVDLNKDFAVSINYFFKPNLVFKLENHWNKGFWFDDIPFETLLYDTPWTGQYFLLSLSVSF